MKWLGLAASVLLGLLAVAGINLVSPDYTAAVMKSVEAKDSTSALRAHPCFFCGSSAQCSRTQHRGHW